RHATQCWRILPTPLRRRKVARRWPGDGQEMMPKRTAVTGASLADLEARTNLALASHRRCKGRTQLPWSMQMGMLVLSETRRATTSVLLSGAPHHAMGRSRGLHRRRVRNAAAQALSTRRYMRQEGGNNGEAQERWEEQRSIDCYGRGASCGEWS